MVPLFLAVAGGEGRAAVPFSMSSVNLTGEWKLAQDANQAVLMSLNFTELTCHFTSTANLTACLEPSMLWHSYTRPSPSTTSFQHKVGFLATGDDAHPAAELPFAGCEELCMGLASCLGFTFQSDAATPATPVKCYFKSAIHFTASHSACVAPGGEGKPGCSPLPGEMSLGGCNPSLGLDPQTSRVPCGTDWSATHTFAPRHGTDYGHYQGHWLSATAFLVNSTGNATVAAAAERVMRVYAEVMAAWKAKYGDDGYLFPYDPLVWDKLLAGKGAGPYYSVPFYTLHKLMAGLLDQHTHAGSALGLELVTRIAGWVDQRVAATLAAGGEALWQKVLLTEWGGMNDVLFNLHAISGDPRHLALARKFNGWVFTAPLASGHDDLADLPFPHANFHLPEVIGNARAYELTGNATDAAVVRTFFDALTANHSYATGGSNSGECWQQPRDLGNFLSTQTEESCTQYNVLKVARHLFQWRAEARYADFYERAILNGIVGNQNRHDDAGVTSYIYMLPLGGVVKKGWGKSDYGFPCCWGTLSESFAKLSDSIFFASADGATVYVNQFVSAAVEVQPGVRLSQVAAGFTTDLTSTLTLSIAQPLARGALELKVRVPSWLHYPCDGCVLLNGAPLPGKATPGTYFTVSAAWKDGDTVALQYTPTLWTAPLNDHHARLAPAARTAGSTRSRGSAPNARPPLTRPGP